MGMQEENNWEVKIAKRNAEQPEKRRVSPTRLAMMTAEIRKIREERNCGDLEVLCILTERSALAPEEDIKEK